VQHCIEMGLQQGLALAGLAAQAAPHAGGAGGRWLLYRCTSARLQNKPCGRFIDQATLIRPCFSPFFSETS
jgi:hypothetical protein